MNVTLIPDTYTRPKKLQSLTPTGGSPDVQVEFLPPLPNLITPGPRPAPDISTRKLRWSLEGLDSALGMGLGLEDERDSIPCLCISRYLSLYCIRMLAPSQLFSLVLQIQISRPVDFGRRRRKPGGIHVGGSTLCARVIWWYPAREGCKLNFNSVNFKLDASLTRTRRCQWFRAKLDQYSGGSLSYVFQWPHSKNAHTVHVVHSLLSYNFKLGSATLRTEMPVENNQ